MEISAADVRDNGILTSGALMNSHYKTTAGKLTYTSDSDMGLIKANLYRNTMNWDFFATSFSDYTNVNNEVLVAQLEDTYEINPQHIVRVQGEYRHNSMEANTLIPANAKIEYKVYALSGMWNWKFSDNWAWTNALRADHLQLERSGEFSASNVYDDKGFDQHFTTISYNSGLVWHASDANTVRFNIARGIEVPSLLEFGLDVSDIVNLEGDPRIDPAVVTNYELAWDHQLSAINGLFRSAIFYNKTEDIKTIDAKLSAGTIYADNIGDSDMYGIELSVEGQFKDHYNWGLGYIYEEIDDHYDNGRSGSTVSISKAYEDTTPITKSTSTLVIKTVHGKPTPLFTMYRIQSKFHLVEGYLLIHWKKLMAMLVPMHALLIHLTMI